jgi:uncharacterized protein YndB with AHSA1/START domain
MSASNPNVNDQRRFTLKREINAPLSLVWKVHTEAEHLSKWWGPKGMKMVKTIVDLRPGGVFHYGMEAPDGTVMWGKFVYREIVPEEKLSFVVSFSDENQGMAKHPMAPDWPMEILTEMHFVAEGSKTIITLSGHPVNATDAEIETYFSQFAQESMKGGFGGTYDELDAYLTTIQ